MGYYSLNKVILVGRLGQDPEVRYTKNGNAVANLSLATTERFKDSNGEQQERTEWHKIVSFNQTAEFAKEYLTKGTMLAIEGRLRTNKWQDKNGNNRSTTEILTSDITILQGKGSKNQPPQPDTSEDAPQMEEEEADEIPF